MERNKHKIQVIVGTLAIISILSIVTYFSYINIEEILGKNIQKEYMANVLESIKNILFKQIILSILLTSILLYKIIYCNLKNSYTDYLTQIKNKKFLDMKLKKYVNFSNAKKISLSIMMIDIDDFKNVNDMYGHLVGDMMLKYVANIIKNNVRSNDICCKYGGDEFMVVLPRTEIKQAEIIANRINKILEENPYILNDDIREAIYVSLSIGIAETKENINETELVKCADKALYEAKAKGKKTVVMYNWKYC